MRTTYPIALIVVVACAFAVACGGSSETAAPEPEVVADLAGLADGWNTIEPGGDTTCSDGSPFRFLVRPGAPDKLAFYLQGGGGCWSGATCDADLRPTYTVNLDGLDPERWHGMFAFGEEDNPFADHSVVYVPYCTADVHLGNAVKTYDAPSTDEHEAHQVTIQHQGAVNVAAALDWTKQHFFAPETIFVTGSSAGSIPSPYYAVELSSSYPDARVTALGDGSGGYREMFDVTRPHDAWATLDVIDEHAAFAELSSDEFDFTKLYIQAAVANPELQLASYDTAEDEVQLQFLAISGSQTTSLQPLLDANLADISTAVPGFVSYVAGGEVHTILGRPELYSYRVGDVRLLDWLAGLANGQAVSSVHCGEHCTEAELVEGVDAMATATGSAP